MNFTSKINLGSVGRVLTVAVLGFVGFAAHPARIIAMPDALAEQKLVQSGNVPVLPAVEVAPQAGLQGPQANVQLVTHWYNNKHWWKKNAPIVGGAAGGALIGGLAGGGKGLLIGGAAGAGGGYLYKHFSERHHRHEVQQHYREQQRYRSASAAHSTTSHTPAQ
jgi:uncharacterized protein YcfJ